MNEDQETNIQNPEPDTQEQDSDDIVTQPLHPWEEGTLERSNDGFSLDMGTLPRLQQGFAAAALRDIGRVREVNQDSIFALTTTLPRGSSDLSTGLFIVADGMGGHEDGDIASRIAIRTIVDHVFTNFMLPMLNEEMAEAMQTLIVSAVEQANKNIWDYAQMLASDMGATCTVALLVGNTIYIAHVGDTRAYILNNETLHALTTDHSTVGRLVQLGQLDPAEARTHPLRSQLYRSIGQTDEVEVDLVTHILNGSSHLLLCSDGLWDMVDETDIASILLHSSCPQQASQDLIDLANEHGGEDNISAIVVTLPLIA